MDTCRVRGHQRGVATLAVVMVLFFIIALTAAYTSRNMIFEQKTSANQYRSTLAFEAAEAGIEWTLGMLNGGLVNDNCGNVNPTASFQGRYLGIDTTLGSATSGRVVNRVGRPIAAPGNWPACAFDGTRWNNTLHCACPNDIAILPTAPVGSDFYPAFRVWLGDPTAPTQIVARPGVVALQSNGCTKLPAPGERCLDRDAQGDVGDGLATLRVLLALRSGLGTIPAAAVTARTDVTPDPTIGNPRLRVVNLDARTNGVIVDAGGVVDVGRISATTLPGVPAETAVVGGDSRLLDLTNNQAAGGLDASERMFVAQFGMSRATYREQPGLRRCPAGCTAADINALLVQNPGRIIWVEGSLTLDADLGLPAGVPPVPVLLIVNGDTLTLGSGVDIYGFVYLTGGVGAGAVTLNLPDGPTSITGALVAETSLATAYAGAPAPGDALTVTYDPGVLNTLRNGYGSWVRVPGSWRDFRE
jgi:hypothetical protein